MLLEFNEATIRIPDDLAGELGRIAAAQRSSVEEVALESLRRVFGEASSPEAVLQLIRALPQSERRGSRRSGGRNRRGALATTKAHSTAGIMSAVDKIRDIIYDD